MGGVALVGYRLGQSTPPAWADRRLQPPSSPPGARGAPHPVLVHQRRHLPVCRGVAGDIDPLFPDHPRSRGDRIKSLSPFIFLCNIFSPFFLHVLAFFLSTPAHHFLTRHFRGELPRERAGAAGLWPAGTFVGP